MLRILTQPVQSVAPSFVRVLKYAPNQPRHPKGSSEGGKFAKKPGANPTHARSGDVILLRQAVKNYTFAQLPPKLLKAPPDDPFSPTEEGWAYPKWTYQYVG